MNHILPNKPYPQNISSNSSSKTPKDVNACKRVGSFKVDIKRKSHITRSKR